jgi:ComF family protein
LQQPPAFDASAALFAYAFPIVRLIHALKYGHQLAIAQWLGKTLATRLNPADCDAIIGLPLHPSRLQERGFNQSIEIARPISRAWQRPLYIDVLQRTRAPPQAELPLKARQANVRGAFECVADLSGQRILLLDDVMTTGATLDECARVLKLHGASSVTVAVAARALKH